MPSILIRLDPGRMENPDADLRYVVPDRLVEMSGGLLADDGYDYEDGTRAMLIYLSTADVDAALPFIVDLLENRNLCDNRLADVAVVATSPGDHVASPGDFVVVYPTPGRSS